MYMDIGHTYFFQNFCTPESDTVSILYSHFITVNIWSSGDRQMSQLRRKQTPGFITAQN